MTATKCDAPTTERKGDNVTLSPTPDSEGKLDNVQLALTPNESKLDNVQLASTSDGEGKVDNIHLAPASAPMPRFRQVRTDPQKLEHLRHLVPGIHHRADTLGDGIASRELRHVADLINGVLTDRTTAPVVNQALRETP